MKYRVLRGGTYYNGTWDMRTAHLNWNGPVCRGWADGFRLVVIRRKQ